MVRFIVSKDDVENTYDCQPSETILQLKGKIKKDFKLNENDYVDIEFLLDKPIRVLGKFNVEPGILPRTMDRYENNRFAFEEKETEISITFHIVTNFKQPIIKKAMNKPSGVYRAPVGQVKSGDSLDSPGFDISSNDDFPSL